MAAHSVLSKTDKALVAYIISATTSTTSDTFQAKRASDLPNPPFTVCYSESANETHPYSGVYTVRAAIEIHTNAAPDVEQDEAQMTTDSDDRVAEIFDAFHDFYSEGGEKLAALITAAAVSAGVSDYTIQDVQIRTIEQEAAKKEGEWIDIMNLEIICCPKTLS